MRHSAMFTTGDAMMFTPPTTAMSVSPLRSDAAAKWAPTSEEEHAVSMVSDGPRRSKAKEMRLEAMLDAEPGLLKLFITVPSCMRA